MLNSLRSALSCICLLCKGPLHPSICCREAQHKRREEQMRMDERNVHYDEFHPHDSYYDSPYKSNMDYYDEQNRHVNSYDKGITKKMSYQEEYDYGDYYDEYSQLSYEGPQMYDQDYYHAQYTFDQYGYECVTQQPTLHYQSHKSESLDEMMRKRHMVHVEKELTKPHLSMEERVELLEWKYDLLPKEVKEMRPGTSILEKRQAKQHWIYVQIEQMTAMGDVEEKVVSPPELETELLGPNEEYTIEIIVEEPPMESKVEDLLLDEPIKVDYNSPAVVVMETKSVKDACLETRKVALHDVGDFIHKLCFWESLDLLGTENEVVKWRVNYRAFVGNSVGKCGFKEFCKERWDVTKHAHNRRIKHRAYISNEKGKCALRPP